ncbi:U32 family peptidase [Anaerorhabdus sp.]|uniref:U32 family peptidase n=1 Tax=Anaerorhabdus sp. TaxID=1872524 RepID=UPI002FCC5F39
MKKIEVLAPAGTMEALKAAVLNGADAIYCGGSNFGARAFAGNFNHDEMNEAVDYCHLYGVKLYVTMNTLLYEDEIDMALQEAEFYYSIGIDALIIQDLGLFDLIHQQYPDIELHCSTQMHIHNVEGVKQMRDSGAARVVLARETPIELIEQCCNQGVDIEVFVYGALCVSYSGQCLISSVMANRSGNRGACAQYCRMQYELWNQTRDEQIQTEGNYLLSPKDLNIINEIPRLLDAGVTSLKIEGRMKRPEYVALVVRTFRDAVDAYSNNQQYKCLPERLNELKLLFNRGFTNGHIFHDNGKNFMSALRPNHMGLPLGKVIYADRNSFQIKLEMPLHQHDGLRILDDKEDLGFIANKIIKDGKYVNRAEKGDIVTFEDSRFVMKGAQVLKTTDVELMDSLLNKMPYRRIKITMNYHIEIGKPFRLEVSDGIYTSVMESQLTIQVPQKAPVEESRLLEQLEKLTDTPYEMVKGIGNYIPFFLPIKEINETRRRCIEDLSNKRMQKPMRRKFNYKNHEFIPTETKTIVEVNSLEQAQVVSEWNVFMCSSKQDVRKAFTNCIPKTPAINEASLYPNETCVISDIGGLSSPNKLLATNNFNVTNSYALSYLYSKGVKMIELSTECNERQIKLCIDAFKKRLGVEPSTLIFSYGKRDLMISKSCPVNTWCSDGNKRNCRLCKTNRYILKDMKGFEYLFMGDDNCIQYLLEPTPFERDIIDPSCAFIRFTDESSNDVQEIMKSNGFAKK